MITDWYNAELCTEWIREMGEYGDLPRQVFSHPIALGLAKALSKKKLIQSGILKESVLELADKIVFERLSYDTKMLRGINCLDLGCGDGCLGRFLNNFEAKYLGLDGSLALTQSANNNYKSSTLRLELANLDLLNCIQFKHPIFNVVENFFDSQKIDIIFCHSLIEHLKNFTDFFRSLSTWTYKNYPKAIISLVCLQESFLSSTCNKIQKINTKEPTFTHSLEVPHTNNIVRINFFSEDDIDNVICKTHYRIMDKLEFTGSLYSPSIHSVLNSKLNNWNKCGPFKAYLIAPKNI